MTQITVSATRYGGEHTIGTITQEQGQFWYHMGNELFTEYLHFQNMGWGGDLNEKWNIPEHLQLSEFYEIDDIDHINAPEFADQNQIEFAKVTEDGKEETVATLDFADAEVREKVLIADEETVNYEGDDVVVYAQSFVKGGFMTAFEIDGEFDLSKLKILCSSWDDLLLVTGFGYGGDELDHNGWQDDSLHKGQCAWIDEDTLKGDHDEWCNANPELMKQIEFLKMDRVKVAKRIEEIKKTVSA